MRAKTASRALRYWAVVMPAVLIVLGLLSSLTVEAAPPRQTGAGLTPTPTSPPATPVTPEPPTSTPAPEVGTVDPVITKWGEPALALPDEEVTFWIEATNEGSAAAIDVVITDVVPDYLEILEVTASQGAVAIDGQTVTVDVGTMGSGFTVVIVIRTRVTPDAPAPMDMTNIAVLDAPNVGERTSAPATVVVPATYLPTTGVPSDLWPLWVIGLLAILAATLWIRKPERE